MTIGANLWGTPSTGVDTTLGGVPFFLAGGVQAVEPTKFYWDAVNDRLGIGTDAPTVTLDVAGAGQVRDYLDVGGSVTLVNKLRLIGAVAGGGGNRPNITAVGADSIIDLGIFTKSTGSMYLGTRLGNSIGLAVIDSGVVNEDYWAIQGASAGGIPTIKMNSSSGTVNIPGQILTKGTGELFFGSHDGAAYQAAIGAVPNAVNQVKLQGAITGVGGPGLVAIGSDASIGLSLTHKGTAKMILSGHTTGVLVGAAGGAAALPATPLGYLWVVLNGLGSVLIPYYLP